MEELGSTNLKEKGIKQTILAAINHYKLDIQLFTCHLYRTGLTKHPLDLRGSRRALEAAKIFLEVEDNKEKLSFLNTSVILPPKPSEDSSGVVCPTVACQWMTSKLLKLLSLFVSHPNTIPLLFVFFSFVVWLYDCITDMVIIELLWNFRIPIMLVCTFQFNSDINHAGIL